VKEDEMTRVCTLCERRNVYRIVIGKPAVKDSMGCQNVGEGGIIQLIFK